MIVVDSSALLAVLLREPEKQTFQQLIAAADRCVISAVNAHETAAVLRIRHGRPAVELLWQLLAENEIEIFPFDKAQVRVVADAFDRYGKGISLPRPVEPFRLRSLRAGQNPQCAAPLQG